MRRAVWGAGVLPMGLMLLGVGYSPLPSYSGVMHHTDLTDTVTISRDDYGIPSIHANTRADLLFGQGFVHAQDRLYAMDLMRRVARGRLAEILGPAALEIDTFTRNLKIHLLAQHTLSHLSVDLIRELESYAKGVNTYVKRSTMLPWEYQLLWVDFEPWEPVDTLACVQVMGVKWGLEFLRYQLGKVVGEDMVSVLLPDHLPSDLTTYVIHDSDMPGEIHRHSSPSDFHPSYTSHPLKSALQDGEIHPSDHLFSLGSNAWVISGKHTQSGKPLLANDTHMNRNLPCFWYLVWLYVKDRYVTGGSVPGIPGILTGRNNDMAWGITAFEGDNVDLYIEKRNPERPNEYLYNAQYEEFTYRVETLKVKGELRAREVVFEETRHGPVLKEYGKGPLAHDTKYIPHSIDQTLSINWTMYGQTDTTIQAIFSFWEVKSVADFRTAMKLVTCCMMGVVYATETDIGYQVTGLIPDVAHRIKPGNRPLEGWNTVNHWVKTLPFESLPFVINPQSGFIVTANNEPGRNYAHMHSLGTNFLHFRAKRITDLIEKHIKTGEKMDISDMVRIQMDDFSVIAEEILPNILNYASESAKTTNCYKSLASWSFHMCPECTEPSEYQVLLTHLMHHLLSDEIQSKTLLRSVVNAPASMDFMYVLFGRTGRDRERWCDDITTQEKETCSSLISRLLHEIDGFSLPVWSRIHSIDYSEFPFSNITLLHPFFHKSVPIGGSSETINSHDCDRDLKPEFRSGNGANIRLVVDMKGEGLWSVDTVRNR